MNNTEALPGAPVIIVTGASRGYGAAIVHELLAVCPTCRIVATARSPGLVQKIIDIATERQVPKQNLRAVIGDITDTDVVKNVVDTAITYYGRIDVVVQNAGIIEPIAGLDAVGRDSARAVFDVNVFAAIELGAACLPHLRRTNGKMVLISSAAAHVAFRGMSLYSLSKAALTMYAKCIAIEEKGQVLCAAIRPGVLDTDMQAVLREKGSIGLLDKDTHDFFMEMYQSGSLVPPRRSANAVARLCFFMLPEFNGKLIDWEEAAVQNLPKKYVHC